MANPGLWQTPLLIKTQDLDESIQLLPGFDQVCSFRIRKVSINPFNINILNF